MFWCRAAVLVEKLVAALVAGLVNIALKKDFEKLSSSSIVIYTVQIYKMSF